MVRHLLTTSLVVLSFVAYGQHSVSVAPNPIHGVGTPDDTDIAVYVDVTNTSETQANLLWRRIEVEKPAGWLSWVCDLEACYDPGISAAPESRPNELGPGEMMSFEIHINPNNSEGVAQIHFELFDASDPETTLATIESTFETTTTSVRDIAAQKDMRVFPNPTVNYFRIYQDERVARIIIYDLAGTPLKDITASNEGWYDVSALRSGLYLVRLLAYDQSVLKTVRLSKR